MKEKKFILIIFCLSLISTLLSEIGILFFAQISALWLKILISAFIFVLVSFIVFAFVTKREKLFRSLFVFSVIVFSVVLVYIAIAKTGVMDHFSSIDEVRIFVDGYGVWGYLIYCLIHLLGVLVLPIPGVLLPLAGVAMYGPLKAFLISYISIVIGSIIMFFIGRVFGKKVVEWCAGKETVDKYLAMFDKKVDFAFVVMQVLPFFPDDLLCMIAGISKMSMRFFLISLFITKAIGLITCCYFGSGSIIPFSSWGIPVWCVIIVAIVVFFIFFTKNKEKIEKHINDRFGGKLKLNSKSDNEKNEVFEEKNDVLTKENRMLANEIDSVPESEKK